MVRIYVLIQTFLGRDLAGTIWRIVNMDAYKAMKLMLRFNISADFANVEYLDSFW